MNLKGEKFLNICIITLCFTTFLTFVVNIIYTNASTNDDSLKPNTI